MGDFYNVRLEDLIKLSKIADNANLIASANNMLIGASFAPIVSMKIVTCPLAINENVDALLKDFAFSRLYF